MANATYNRGLFHLGKYRWTTDPVNLGVMLVTNTYVFSRLHNIVGDIGLINEASGPGYGRRPLEAAYRTVTEDDGSSWAQFKITSGSLLWVAIDAGTDLRVVLFFVNGASILDDANNDLLCYYDTGTSIPITTDGSDFRLNFSALGAFTLA